MTRNRINKNLDNVAWLSKNDLFDAAVKAAEEHSLFDLSLFAYEQIMILSQALASEKESLTPKIRKEVARCLITLTPAMSAICHKTEKLKDTE